MVSHNEVNSVSKPICDAIDGKLLSSKMLFATHKKKKKKKKRRRELELRGPETKTRIVRSTNIHSQNSLRI
jgi:hypothetical protein